MLLAGCVNRLSPPHVYLPLTPREAAVVGCYKLQIADNFNGFSKQYFQPGKRYEYVYLDSAMAILSYDGKIGKGERRVLFPNDPNAFNKSYEIVYWHVDADKDIITWIIGGPTATTEFILIPEKGTLAGAQYDSGDIGSRNKTGEFTATKISCDSIPGFKKQIRKAAAVLR